MPSLDLQKHRIFRLILKLTSRLFHKADMFFPAVVKDWVFWKTDERGSRSQAEGKGQGQEGQGRWGLHWKGVGTGDVGVLSAGGEFR